MAHPVRAEWAEELSEKTGLPIHWDSYGDPTHDPERRWQVGRECWEILGDTTAEWGFVLQDDAKVCRDLMPAVASALEVLNGEGVFSAYLGTGRPVVGEVRAAIGKAAQHKSSWVTLNQCYWGVAIGLPLNTVPDMLAWASKSNRKTEGYDYRIGTYYRNYGWRTQFTFPSLVDHRDQDTLSGNFTSKPRVAYNFLGENNSGTDIDWSNLPPNGLEKTLPPRSDEYRPSRISRIFKDGRRIR